MSVSCRLALRDYRAVFSLICAPHMVDFIDRLLSGEALGETIQRFGRLHTDDAEERWVVGDPAEHPNTLAYNRLGRLPYHGHFGLHERSFYAVMDLLRRCAENRDLLYETVTLPNLSVRRSKEDGIDGRGRIGDVRRSTERALFGDGLAVVDDRGWSFPDKENFTWF